MPLFALANAGVRLDAETLRQSATSPVTLGIVVALVVGKSVGISGSTLLALRLRIGVLPGEIRRGQLIGGATLAGIGFTVALFIADLAFADPALREQAVIGVLAGSLLAALLGGAVFRLFGDRGGVCAPPGTVPALPPRPWHEPAPPAGAPAGAASRRLGRRAADVVGPRDRHTQRRRGRRPARIGSGAGEPGSLVGGSQHPRDRRWFRCSPETSPTRTSRPSVSTTTPPRRPGCWPSAGCPAWSWSTRPGMPHSVLPGSQVLRFVIPGYVQDDPMLARVYDERHADLLTGKLAGTPVRALLRAERTEPPVVDGKATAVEIAAVMARLRSPLVAVVDGGRFVGVVTVGRLLERMLP